MPSPLDFIQNLSQKVLSGQKAGAETKATAGEADSKAEAFSSALAQALKPKAEPQAKPDKPENVTKQGLAGLEPQSEASSKKPGDLTPEIIPAELLALQPVGAPVELPPQAAGLAQAISQLSVQATLNTPAEQAAPQATQAISQASQPVAAETMAPAGSVASKTPPVTTPIIEPLAGETGDPQKSEAGSETIVLAQSLGFSTLSPEAMLMMGIPVEFQVQNALNQMPTQPAASEADMTQAVQPAGPQAIIPSAQPAELELEATFPLPTQADVSVQTFDQALQQANPEAAMQTTNAINPESAFVIDDAAIQAATPELAPMLELPNGPDSLQFNEVLTQAAPRSFSPDGESAPNGEFEALGETGFMPIAEGAKGEAKAIPQANGKPSTQKSAEEILKPLTELGKTLNALNGEIESVNQNEATTGDSEEFTLPEEALTGSEQTSTPPLSVDVQAPINLNPNTPTEASNKLPQFISPAIDPADQVVDGTVYSVKNGHKELILKINPDNLGEVRINLTSHGDNGLSARLIASNPESHELLKTQADSLKASLEAQGVRIERLSVVLAGQTESGSNASQQDQSQSFQSQQQQQQSSQPGQQQSFQQPEQNLNPFFQAGGQFQNKQGFAQNPGGGRYGQTGVSGDVSSAPEAPTRRNDNGSVSLLA